MDEKTRKSIADNIFPAAHDAIEDWDSFLWHQDNNNQIDTWKINSSQAMVIDVFGSIAGRK